MFCILQLCKWLCSIVLVLWSVQASADGRLEIVIGHSIILPQEQAVDVVIVGNSEVADATVVADRSVLVTGLSVGRTNLIIADETGREVSQSILNVVPLDRRPSSRVRVMRGGVDEDAWYVCRPGDGCVPTTAAGGIPLTLPQSSTTYPQLTAPHSGPAVLHSETEMEIDLE